MPWQKGFDKGLKSGFKDKNNFQLFFEYLDAGRIKDRDNEAFLNFLKQKYQSINIDFIITESTAASTMIFNSPDFLAISKKLYINASLDFSLQKNQTSPYLNFSIKPDFQ